MTPSGEGQRGFTLIEALVALVILAMSLTAVFGSLGVGVLTAASAERDRRVVELASNLLAELGTTRPLEVGVAEGTAVDGLRWRLRLTEVRFVEAPGPSPLRSFAVDLVVKLLDGGGERRFRTLIVRQAT